MNWQKESINIYHTIRKRIEESSKKNNGAAGIFGSSSRRELTPFSDIDIFYLEDGSNEDGGSLLKERVGQNLKYPVDVVGCDEKELSIFPLVNGTNYHSVYFLTDISGNISKVNYLKEAQKNIFSLEQERIREFINIIGNLRSYARTIKMGDKRWIKFCQYGTNFWVKIFQLAQIRWPRLVGKNTEEMIDYLCASYDVSDTKLKKNWLALMQERIRQEGYYLQGREFLKYFSEDKDLKKLLSIFLSEAVVWIQDKAGVDESKLSQLINDCFQIKLEIPPPRIVSRPNSNLLAAIVSDCPEEIRELAVVCGADWWVATNLALNPDTPSDVLEYLVFPPFLVNTFTWRTVRLYVGKNKKTDLKTLKRLLNTPGLRDQDYEAARSNIITKNNTNEE